MAFRFLRKEFESKYMELKETIAHNVVDAQPDVFHVVLNPLEHPVLGHTNDILIHIAMSQHPECL
jgi:hypothetical protein